MNLHCDECNGELIQTETGYVCSECGLVADKLFKKITNLVVKRISKIDGQYVEVSQQPAKTKALGTYLGIYGQKYLRDKNGKHLNRSKSLQFSRLKKINDVYLCHSQDHRKYRGQKILAEYGVSLQLTESARADALYIFNNYAISSLKYKRLLPIVLACIYLSVRHRKENLELNTIIKTAISKGEKVKGKDIIKIAADIKSSLGMQIRPIRSELYIEKILTKIIADSSIKKLLLKRTSDIDKYQRSLRLVSRRLLLEFPVMKRGGRNPFILASAVIVASDVLLAQKKFFPECYKYKSKRGILTQKKVSQILDIAEFTLREHYLLLKNNLLNNFLR